MPIAMTEDLLLVTEFEVTYLQTTQEIQSSTQVSHESQNDQQNNQTTEAPLADSGSISASSNDGRKVSRQDIELVRRTFFFFPVDFLWYLTNRGVSLCCYYYYYYFLR